MTSTPNIELTLGDFDLFGDGATWRCETLADGTDLSGNPVPVEVAIRTLIQDGSVSFTEKYDNATVTIMVCLSAPDAEALDDGAAALFAELGKPNVLTYRGPQAFGSVAWDVVNSRLDRTPDDLGEVRGDRFYTVTLTVLPFRRAVDKTVALGLPTSGATVTVLDDGSATTGWAGSVDGVATAPATSSGAVSVTSTAIPGVVVLELRKTFAATTTSTKLLRVDWFPTPTQDARLDVYGDGTLLPLVAEQASPTSGFTRSYFYVSAASLAVTQFVMISKPLATAAARSLRLDAVAVTNAGPTIGTARQQVRSLEVNGSARTSGTLSVQSETSALGDSALLYVYPCDPATRGYSPSMRQFRVTGGTETPNAALISGKSEDLQTGTEFRVPIGLFPVGSYLLLGALTKSVAGAVDIDCVTWTQFGSGTALTTESRTFTPTLTTGWKTYVLGKFSLPTVALSPDAHAAGAFMAFSLKTDIAAGVSFDEMWLFNTDIGRLIQVDCGTGSGAVGGSARRLFVNPPTLTTPRNTVRIGHSADGSDSFHPPSLGSWQFPEFRPPQVNVLAVTPNATDAVIALDYYERLAG